LPETLLGTQKSAHSGNSSPLVIKRDDEGNSNDGGENKWYDSHKHRKDTYLLKSSKLLATGSWQLALMDLSRSWQLLARSLN
jgi:hypothetical protein